VDKALMRQGKSRDKRMLRDPVRMWKSFELLRRFSAKLGFFLVFFGWMKLFYISTFKLGC
jgi:hypothetical protein